MAGKSGTCPHCGLKITMPNLPDGAAPPPPPERSTENRMCELLKTIVSQNKAMLGEQEEQTARMSTIERRVGYISVVAIIIFIGEVISFFTGAHG